MGSLYSQGRRQGAPRNLSGLLGTEVGSYRQNLHIILFLNHCSTAGIPAFAGRGIRSLFHIPQGADEVLSETAGSSGWDVELLLKFTSGWSGLCGTFWKSPP